jgi:hypothetical protein
VNLLECKQNKTISYLKRKFSMSIKQTNYDLENRPLYKINDTPIFSNGEIVEIDLLVVGFSIKNFRKANISRYVEGIIVGRGEWSTGNWIVDFGVHWDEIIKPLNPAFIYPYNCVLIRVETIVKDTLEFKKEI